MDRHDRQARLAGVGVAGQRAIAAATVDVRGGGLAAEVATRYLAGAGVGALRVGDPALGVAATSIDAAVRVEVDAVGSSRGPQAPSTDEGAFGLRDPSAREVAQGAREALLALRGILEGAS
jgi:hypothetical protein